MLSNGRGFRWLQNVHRALWPVFPEDLRSTVAEFLLVIHVEFLPEALQIGHVDNITFLFCISFGNHD